MSRKARIAIVGTGIAGNVAAFKLRDRFDITVYEAAGYVGGHTNTVDVTSGDDSVAIDTGFIVFNDRTYPNFLQLLDEIGQESQSSQMSFSVHSKRTGIEYAGSSLNGLFAQRRNIVRPSFHRMVLDILRFNRDAVSDLSSCDTRPTMGSYLARQRYSSEFVDHYLVPMAAAIWSTEPIGVLDMPAEFLLRFFNNHGLLQLKDRPQWRVIKGGSREYVRKLVAGHCDRIRLNSPVQAVRRRPDRVEIQTAKGGAEVFDYAIICCHSDQALNLLETPSDAEREVLGAIRYQPNEAILHTDTGVLPKRRRAWSSWNYCIDADEDRNVAVSYNMNILQGLDSDTTYCVTLNDDSQIGEDKIVRRIQYQHPMFTTAAIAAQKRQRDINRDRTFYCGAYWRNGFHEDGVVSALNAIDHLEEAQTREELYLQRAG